MMFLIKGNVFPHHVRQHVFDNYVTSITSSSITTAIVEIAASKALDVSLSFSANGATSKPRNIIENQPIEHLKLDMPRRDNLNMCAMKPTATIAISIANIEP